jgi:hypothetical protein
VHLGFHAGNTTGVARYGYISTGTGYRYITDVYSNGATATWGSGGTTVGGGQQLAITGIIALAGGGGGLAAVDVRDGGVGEGQVDTFDFGANLDVAVASGVATITAPMLADHETRIDSLEAGTGGGEGITTAVVDTGSLTAAEESAGPWLDTGSSGGVFIAGASKATGGAGTLYVEDSADGVTGTIRNQMTATLVGGNYVANVMALTGQRYVRVRYVNGASGVTGFELTSGLSVTA